MSNTKRPTTARKVTTKDEAARRAALNDAIAVRIDDVVYTLTPADLTGLHEMKIRKATGMTVGEIMEGMESSPGLDVLGFFMFACELGAGRDADLEGILGSISYASGIDLVEDAEPEPAPQP